MYTCIKALSKCLPLALLIGSGLSYSQAIPKSCIQSPERTQVCPHQILKQAAVAVPSMNIEKGGVVCICLSDLEVGANLDKSKLAEIDRQVTIQRIATKYLISEQDLRKLVKH